MSSDPKNYFGFRFEEFTELDCRMSKHTKREANELQEKRIYDIAVQ